MGDERPAAAGPEAPVLAALHLNKTYRKRRWFSYENGVTELAAMRDVSLEIGRGLCIGLVGESGSGKSTVARSLAFMEPPDSGQIWVNGRELAARGTREWRQQQRALQLVLQGSAASLDPRFSALEAVAEPLEIARQGSRREQQECALELMAKVGLSGQAANRRSTEFSGGERQRLAIARALALEPKVLILDESLAGLDLPVQAQMVNLLVDLRASLGISYLFISHDLHLAAHLSDELLVMADGRIVERGAAQEVARRPQHERTRALLGAADPRALERT